VKGPRTKPLVLFGIALMLVNLPCLAACIACSNPAPVPACHHKAPVHEDSQQPCPHQIFRAVASTAKTPDAPVHHDTAWAELPIAAGPANGPALTHGLPLGLSPPRSDLAPLFLLRV
jgi:hypothetical protein